MKRISIKEGDITIINAKEIGKVENSDEKDTVHINKNIPIERKIEHEFKSDYTVPSIPKTSVQFLIDWKKYKSMEIRYQYLKVYILFCKLIINVTFNSRVVCILSLAITSKLFIYNIQTLNGI